MKLIVEISSWFDGKSGGHVFECLPRLCSDHDLDIVEHDNFKQAEDVAKLTEISSEIMRIVKAYNSKDPASMPKVLKKSSTEPLTE